MGAPDTLAPQAEVAIRFLRLCGLVENLTKWRPDFMEAQELLDALEAGLFERFDASQFPNLEAAFKNLRQALDRADRTLGPSDEN